MQGLFGDLVNRALDAVKKSTPDTVVTEPERPWSSVDRLAYAVAKLESGDDSWLPWVYSLWLPMTRFG